MGNKKVNNSRGTPYGRTVNRRKRPLRTERRPPNGNHFPISSEESVNFLNTIFSSTPDPMWVSDHKGTLIMSNSALCNLFNVREKELTGIYNIFKDNLIEGQGYMPLVKKAYKEGWPVSFHLELGDSHSRPAQLDKPVKQVLYVTILPVKDSKGKVTNAMIRIEDVTEQRNAEARLKKSEEKFQKAFEASPLLMSIIRVSDGTYVEVNNAWISFIGYSRDEIINCKVLELDKNDLAIYSNIIRQIDEEGRIYNAELDITTRTGEKRTVLCSFESIILDDQSCLLIVAVDITERNRMLNELDQSEERFRTLIEQSRDGIVILDQDGSVYQANKQFAAMIGYSHDEVRELTVYDWEYSIPHERLLEMLRTVDEAGNFYETVYRRKDKTICNIEISTNAVILNGQRLIFCVCRDITERKKAEERIKESEARFRTIIEQSPIEIILNDFDGNILIANQRDVKAIIKNNTTINIKDLSPEYDIEDIRKNYWETMSPGETRVDQSIFTHLDGSTYSALIHVTRISYLGAPAILTFIMDVTELKKAEEAIHQSEIRFREVVEQAMEGIMVHDIDGNVLMANKKEAEVSGFTLEELLSVNIMQINPIVVAENHKETIWEKMEPGESITLESVAGKKDGTPYPVEVRLARIDYGGRPAFLSFHHDITSRKMAEAEISRRMENERFIAGISAGFVNANIQSIDSAVQRSLADLCTFYHLDRGNIFLKTGEGSLSNMYEWHYEGVTPHTKKYEQLITTKFADSAHVRQMTEPLVVANITQLPPTHGVPIKEFQNEGIKSLIIIPLTLHGRVTGFIGLDTVRTMNEYSEDEVTVLKIAGELFASVLERKSVAEALIAEKNMAQNYLDTAGVIMLVMKEDGIVSLINNKGCEILDRTREEIEGKNWIDNFIPPRMRKEFSIRVSRVFQGGEELEEYMENPILTAHGDERIIAWHNIGLRNDQGKIVALLSSGEDISGRKRAEEEIRLLNRTLEMRVKERTAELATINKELEAFSYSVSHDLRAPLRGIDGFSGILEEEYSGKLDSEARHYIKRIRGATAKMSQLIDDLLALSRVTRSRITVRKVNLSGIVNTIAANLHQVDPMRTVSLNIEDNVMVKGDFHLLSILMENLLGNAWKFTAHNDKAKIEFGVQKDDGKTVYFVRDNGAGFDMAYAGKIFDAFQRLHTESEFPGTGIGLATAQRIVRRHGGIIWAESRVREGSAFFFTLEREEEK